MIPIPIPIPRPPHILAAVATLASRPRAIIAVALLAIAAVGLLVLVWIFWRHVRALKILDRYRRLAGRPLGETTTPPHTAPHHHKQHRTPAA